MTTVYMRDLYQYTRTEDCRTSNNKIYGAHKKYVNKEIFKCSHTTTYDIRSHTLAYADIQ